MESTLGTMVAREDEDRAGGEGLPASPPCIGPLQRPVPALPRPIPSPALSRPVPAPVLPRPVPAPALSRPVPVPALSPPSIVPLSRPVLAVPLLTWSILEMMFRRTSGKSSLSSAKKIGSRCWIVL